MNKPINLNELNIVRLIISDTTNIEIDLTKDMISFEKARDILLNNNCMPYVMYAKRGNEDDRHRRIEDENALMFLTEGNLLIQLIRFNNKLGITCNQPEQFEKIQFKISGIEDSLMTLNDIISIYNMTDNSKTSFILHIKNNINCEIYRDYDGIMFIDLLQGDKN